MIKALATLKDGTKMLVLGLSKANCERLQEGNPIAFDGELYGFAGQIVIMYGETEQSIVSELHIEATRHGVAATKRYEA